MSRPALRRPLELPQPGEALIFVVPPAAAAAVVPAPAAMPAPQAEAEAAVQPMPAPAAEAGAAARPMPAPRIVHMPDAVNNADNNDNNDDDDDVDEEELEDNRVIEKYIEVTFESPAVADDPDRRYSEKATIKTPRDEHSGMRWVVTRCNLELIFALSRLVRYLPDKLSMALNENLTNPGGGECFIRIPLEVIVDVKTHVDNNLDENLRRRLLAPHPNRDVHTDGILLPDVEFPDSGFLEEEGNPANLEDTVEQLYEALQQLLAHLIRGRNDQARVVATRIITAADWIRLYCAMYLEVVHPALAAFSRTPTERNFDLRFEAAFESINRFCRNSLTAEFERLMDLYDEGAAN